ncbi:unnamed protein product [Rhizoctonia solani]|uniref:Uncharacterized protein n=1 Tax=Rhizoctonia solani TaxID=456999 RepID=A0A8H3DG55_9AGAM|nr:unnamed protein product [Rhizoctonia solani]
MSNMPVSDLSTVPANNTLEDFANGIITSFSLDVGLLVIRALVNTVTLMISGEIGIHAPFCGYRILTPVHGNLNDGVRAQFSSPMARGSVIFYLNETELWVELDLLGPLFPKVNGELKVINLGTIYPALPAPGARQELEV